MGKVFNKGLNEDDEKEGLFKKLKNIEDKNGKLLKIKKNKTEDIKEITNFIKESLSLDKMALFEEIRIIQKNVDYRNQKLLVVIMLRMILVILKHLIIYLKTFISKK